ncbi:MAG: hypothetical protein B7W97_00285, partial [Mycobacterium sp. 20-66-4]
MTATDPAPFEMFETIINLKPEKEWRAGMTKEKLVEEMIAAMENAKIDSPRGTWTMSKAHNPIQD